MGRTWGRSGALGRTGVLRTSGAARALAALSIAAAAILALLAWMIVPPLLDRAAAADDLTRQALVGPRNLTCQRIVILLDESGSMTDFAKVRTDAIAILATWAPHNLRKNDQLSVVEWANTAVTTTPPTDIGALDAATLTVRNPDVGGGTEILPAVQQAAGMSRSACRSSLVFVSDGQIDQANAAALDAALHGASVDSVSLILPNSTPAPDYWMQLFPFSETYHADERNTGQTARALGQAIASATRQRLEVRK